MKQKYEVNPLQGSILKNMLLFALPITGADLHHKSRADRQAAHAAKRAGRSALR